MNVVRAGPGGAARESDATSRDPTRGELRQRRRPGGGGGAGFTQDASRVASRLHQRAL